MKFEEQEQVIERWMMQASQSGKTPSGEDLHLDAIDSRWRNRQFWVEASKLAFQIGAATRDKLNLPLAVGLGMSLQSEAVTIPGEISLADLLSLVDWTPPSLYLFSNEEELGRDLERAIHERRVEMDAVSLKFRTVDVPAAKSGVFLRFRRISSDEHTCSAFILG
jgi:hypothetical protein